MRRQIMKQPYLVAHIQVLDGFADFLTRAHRRSLAEISSMRRGMRRVRQVEGRRMKEGLRRNKRSTPKAFASRQLNAQRPTCGKRKNSNGFRLKAGLPVPLV